MNHLIQKSIQKEEKQKQDKQEKKQKENIEYPRIQDKELTEEMEKEISNLSEGQEFKNWKDLFEYLHIDLPSGGKGKSIAINHLKQWIAVENVENSNRLKISEVYEEPLELVDGRKGGNHTVYKNYLKIILLNSLLLSDDFEKNYTYSEFWTNMGMCNHYYTDAKKKSELLENNVLVNEDQMDDFFRRTWSIMKGITDSVLESLQAEGMLEYTKGKMIQKKQNSPAVAATKKERQIIGSVETRVMHQMGYKNKKDLFLAHKLKEFREKVKGILRKKYKWINYFDCFNIIAYEKDVLETGIENNINELKLTLNSNITNRVKKDTRKIIEKEHDRVQKDYDNYSSQYALGTPISYEKYFQNEAYKTYSDKNYVEIQDLLTDCFIADPETLIGKVSQLELELKKTV